MSEHKAAPSLVERNVLRFHDGALLRDVLPALPAAMAAAQATSAPRAG